MASLKTRDNLDCFGFSLDFETNENEPVFLTQAEFKIKEKKLTKKDLLKLIEKQASEEDSQENGPNQTQDEYSSMQVLVHTAFAFVQSAIEAQIEELKTEALFSLEEHFEKTKSPLRNLVSFLKNSSNEAFMRVSFQPKNKEGTFQDLLEVFLRSQGAKSRETWKKKTKEKVLVCLSKLEKSTEDAVQKTKEYLLRNSEEIERENRPKSPLGRFDHFVEDSDLTERKIRRFDPQNILKMKKMSRDDQLCKGIYGIPKLFDKKASNVFGVFSVKGSFGVFQANEDRLIKAGKIIASEGASVHSSLVFSPDSQLFLVSFCTEKTLMVFDAQTMEVTDKWLEKEFRYIMKAKWLSQTRILAAFGYPGALKVYERGQNRAVFGVFLPEFGTGMINDIEVYSKGLFGLCCGGSNHLVMKILIENGNDLLEWKHKHHGDTPEVVRVSNNKKMVFSGGSDRKIVAVSESNGEILGKFQDFSGAVDEIIFSPSDQIIITCSQLEILIVKLGIGKSVSFRALDKIKTEIFGYFCSGMNVHWGSEIVGDQAYVLIGDKTGNVLKIMLE